jgi:hypothetical protein
MNPAAPVTNSFMEPSSQTPGDQVETLATLSGRMTSDDELDWFGNPLPQTGARLAVPCPFCSELFQQGSALAGHLEAAHQFKVQRRTSPLDRLPSWLRSLGFLPLWFVLPMTVGLVALVYLVVSEYNTWLAVYAAALSTLPLVLVLAHRVFSRRT